jgi:DNA processing protein
MEGRGVQAQGALAGVINGGGSRGMPGFPREMRRMKVLSSDRYLSLLAIQRMTLLRSSEKLAVLSILEGGASLSGLSSRDIEAAVGRSFAGRLPETASLLAEAEGDAILLGRLGARFASLADADYPAILREIPQPPFGVYLRGSSLDQAMPAAAIVGTRFPSGLGIETALSIAGDLAAAGIAVVSGLARGIDGAAHRGALRRAGKTCAVLPCGVEAVYPASNRGLASSILEEGGLLLSEYPPGTEIRKSRFPERNRLISGLARALVVVEAPAGSGALITADFALEQGHDVYVAAACLEGPRSAGLDRLASEGARLIRSGREIVVEWGLSGRLSRVLAGADAIPDAVSLALGCATGSQAEGIALAAALRAELDAAAPSLGGGYKA